MFTIKNLRAGNCDDCGKQCNGVQFVLENNANSKGFLCWKHFRKTLKAMHAAKLPPNVSNLMFPEVLEEQRIKRTCTHGESDTETYGRGHSHSYGTSEGHSRSTTRGWSSSEPKRKDDEAERIAPEEADRAVAARQEQMRADLAALEAKAAQEKMPRELYEEQAAAIRKHYEQEG